ncbi:ABC transporter permease [Sedimentibacter sp. B4]|uniref:ABC transporter permease n=1 Tax=Sedimentibacter sp. B4 TaxID=304766 RepID=UPI00031262BC|nr:ABC transporter permease [Sedimentibacter sp. B4]
MAKYFFKRILIAVPVLIGVAFITFMMLNVVPGDPITVMMREHVKPDVIENLRKTMHLDDPAIIRFLRFLGDALRGNFGTSYKLSRPVSDLIVQAFPITIKLATTAAIISWIIGIPIGIISAIKQSTITDQLFMGFALFGVSMPVFLIGLLGQYTFSYKLGWLPVSGFGSWKQLIMPALVLGWNSAGTIARLTRSNLMEAMKNDYIRTARAKGLKETGVVVDHALKNSLLPVITIMAIQIASLLSGSVITESIFGIPGIGRLSVDAIQGRDMPLLQGSVVFATALIIFGNICADMLYSLVDPRIRVE